MNTLRTGLFLAALTGLFVAAGWLIGGGTGMVIAFVAALAMNLFAYWNADRMVLAMYRARPVDRATAPALYAIVEELAGVLAHELAHVKHRDTLTMTVAAAIAGAIGMIANFAYFFGAGSSREQPLGPIGVLMVAILAPITATLVQLAVSRTREYDADRAGAALCGQPLWLARALARIEEGARRIGNPRAEANPATAHLFIVNPLHGHGLGSLFATHPSTADRIRRLEEMAQSMADAPAVLSPRGPWG